MERVFLCDFDVVSMSAVIPGDPRETGMTTD
jgi:hypothetical protein